MQTDSGHDFLQPELNTREYNKWEKSYKQIWFLVFNPLNTELNPICQ